MLVQVNRQCASIVEEKYYHRLSILYRTHVVCGMVRKVFSYTGSLCYAIRAMYSRDVYGVTVAFRCIMVYNCEFVRNKKFIYFVCDI